MTPAYTIPSTAADGCRLSMEPAAFGQTGAGLWGLSIRDDFDLSECHAIDAPSFLPSGSVRGTKHVPEIDDLKPWHYMSTTVTRP